MKERAGWQAVEVLHDVVYFAEDAGPRFEALGLKGWWMGYFASRSAALGTPSPELVTALFHGFAPRLVARALPDAWSLADPARILSTRLDLARDALRPALIDTDLKQLADGLLDTVRGLDLAGRPLAAAHLSTPVPDDALGQVWWAATVLREYRGDSHIAVLTSTGLDGCSANVLTFADGRTRDDQRVVRGWTEAEWKRGFDLLRERGWTDQHNRITERGRAARAEIEQATDAACTSTFRDQEALVAAARAVAASGAVPFPNPTATSPP